jgi:hypothetical protein
MLVLRILNNESTGLNNNISKLNNKIFNMKK